MPTHILVGILLLIIAALALSNVADERSPHWSRFTSGIGALFCVVAAVLWFVGVGGEA